MAAFQGECLCRMLFGWCRHQASPAQVWPAYSLQSAGRDEVSNIRGEAAPGRNSRERRLPSIQHALHATVSGAQWVVELYTLFLAALILLGGVAGRLLRTPARIHNRRVSLCRIESQGYFNGPS